MVYLFTGWLLSLFIASVHGRTAPPYKYPYPSDRQDTEEYFKCPDDNWVIGRFDNVVYCYRPYQYTDEHPESMVVNIIKNNYCRHLHGKSTIGNVHSSEEVSFLKRHFLEGTNKQLIVGMFKRPGTKWDLLNFEPTDNKSLTYLYLTDNAKDNGKTLMLLDLEKEQYEMSRPNIAIKELGAPFLCKMEAERREPAKEPVTSLPDLTKYSCGNDADDWELASPCGEVYCYKWLTDDGVGIFKDHPTEFNECGERYPGANMASIHCKAEDEYVRRYGSNVIGLYRPFYRVNANSSDLRWQDGSSLNYINLEAKSVLNGYDFPNTIVQQQSYSGHKWKRSEGGKYAARVCKRKAALTAEDALDEEWKPIPNKTVDGKVCADLGHGLTATMCPGKEFKQSFGDKTYCYYYYTIGNRSDLSGFIGIKDHYPVIESWDEYDFYQYKFYDIMFWLYLPENVKNPLYSDLVWLGNTKTPIKFPNIPFEGEAKVPLQFVRGKNLPVSAPASQTWTLWKYEATPINKCPKPFDNSEKKLKDYKCPAGWDKFKACNQVSCYRILETKDERAAKQMIHDNICGEGFGDNVHLASIHCEREDRYIRSKYGKVLLPLECQKSGEFEWIDKSDFNYIPANGFRDFASYVEDNFKWPSRSYPSEKIFKTSSYGDMIWVPEDDNVIGDTKILCKQPATLKKH